jgi:hypothetical protein
MVAVQVSGMCAREGCGHSWQVHNAVRGRCVGEQWCECRDWEDLTPSPTPLDDLIARILDGQMVVEAVYHRWVTGDDETFPVHDWHVSFDPSLSREMRAAVEAEERAANADEVAY